MLQRISVNAYNIGVGKYCIILILWPFNEIVDYKTESSQY